MSRAWDTSAGHLSSVDDAASVGLQLPETAAVRSGACFFNRIQVRWNQVCADWRSQKSWRAINSGLKPLRVPHMARSTIVDDDRANERHDASDVSPMQSIARLGQAATGDSKDYNRFEVCNKALTMVVMRTSRLLSTSSREETAPPPNPE